MLRDADAEAHRIRDDARAERERMLAEVGGERTRMIDDALSDAARIRSAATAEVTSFVQQLDRDRQMLLEGSRRRPPRWSSVRAAMPTRSESRHRPRGRRSSAVLARKPPRSRPRRVRGADQMMKAATEEAGSINSSAREAAARPLIDARGPADDRQPELATATDVDGEPTVKWRPEPPVNTNGAKVEPSESVGTTMDAPADANRAVPASGVAPRTTTKPRRRFLLFGRTR